MGGLFILVGQRAAGNRMHGCIWGSIVASPHDDGDLQQALTARRKQFRGDMAMMTDSICLRWNQIPQLDEPPKSKCGGSLAGSPEVIFS